MVEYLGANPDRAYDGCKTFNRAHIRFSHLKELYEEHLVAATGVEDDEDEVFVIDVFAILTFQTIYVYNYV